MSADRMAISGQFRHYWNGDGLDQCGGHGLHSVSPDFVRSPAGEEDASALPECLSGRLHWHNAGEEESEI